MGIVTDNPQFFLALKKIEIMKNIFIAIIIITVTSCKSKQTKSNVKPLSIITATYQNWYGGREGVRGIKIVIKGAQNSKNYTYKDLYFQNKKAAINTTTNDKIIELTANINTGYRTNERILSSNTNKEYKNTPPTKPKYPNLEKDEAVIEYEYQGKLKSFKLLLKKKKDLFYQ